MQTREISLLNCSNPQLSIIIPVHNQSLYTSACLASIAAFPPHLPYEIVVVDDGSTDDTPQLLIETKVNEYRIRSIRNDIASGFAAACNLGAKISLGSYLIFLNNDTEVLHGWFAPLLNVLERHHDVGLVGPKLIFPDMTVQHCGKVWSDIQQPNSHPQHIYYRFPSDHPAANKSRDYKLLTGACLMARKTEFWGLGGFDERYENGWEDDDLCYEYTTSGKRVYYCAESQIIHHQNKTLNQRLFELENRLPPIEQLHLLDEKQATSSVTQEDIALAQYIQKIYSEMERELERFRGKFTRNRNLFYSKWGNLVKRDDFIYCNADNVPLSEAFSAKNPDMKDVKMPRSSASSVTESSSGPLVSIIILTFNRLDVTKDCIASIQRNTPEKHEIIFVDNGSTDGTISWLRQQVAANSNYNLIENKNNEGFARGCNQGIEAARGEYILLINNDTVVTPEWLSGMLECFIYDKVGIVGPMTNNISGIQQWPWASRYMLKDLDDYAIDFRRKNRYRRIPSRRM